MALAEIILTDSLMGDNEAIRVELKALLDGATGDGGTCGWA